MSKNERATGGKRGRSSRRGGCAPGAHGHSGGGGRVRIVLGVAGSSGPSCAVERCEPIDEKLRACVSTDRPVTRRRRRGGVPVPVPVPVCAASEEAVTEPAGSVAGAEEVLVRGEGSSVSTSKCAVRVGVEGTLPLSAVLSVAGRLREGESGRSGVSPSVSGSDAASCARRIAVIFFLSPR